MVYHAIIKLVMLMDTKRVNDVLSTINALHVAYQISNGPTIREKSAEFTYSLGQFLSHVFSGVDMFARPIGGHRIFSINLGNNIYVTDNGDFVELTNLGTIPADPVVIVSCADEILENTLTGLSSYLSMLDTANKKMGEIDMAPRVSPITKEIVNDVAK